MKNKPLLISIIAIVILLAIAITTIAVGRKDRNDPIVGTYQVETILTAEKAISLKPGSTITIDKTNHFKYNIVGLGEAEGSWLRDKETNDTFYANYTFGFANKQYKNLKITAGLDENKTTLYLYILDNDQFITVQANKQ